jgi:hypothetical protein
MRASGNKSTLCVTAFVAAGNRHFEERHKPYTRQSIRNGFSPTQLRSRNH